MEWKNGAGYVFVLGIGDYCFLVLFRYVSNNLGTFFKKKYVQKIYVFVNI